VGQFIGVGDQIYNIAGNVSSLVTISDMLHNLNHLEILQSKLDRLENATTTITGLVTPSTPPIDKVVVGTFMLGSVALGLG
jgi:hypothetical protein